MISPVLMSRILIFGPKKKKKKVKEVKERDDEKEFQRRASSWRCGETMVVRLMFLIIRIYTDDYRCFQSRGEATNNDSVFQSVQTSLGS